MKRLNFKDDYLEIKKIFNSIQSKNLNLLIWQKEENSRISVTAKLQKNLIDFRLLKIRHDNNQYFNHFKKRETYFYNQNFQLISKVNVLDVHPFFLNFQYPSEILIIEKIEEIKSGEIFNSIENDPEINPQDRGKNIFEIPIWEAHWKDFALIEKMASKNGSTKCPILDFSSGGSSFLFHSMNYFKIGDEILFRKNSAQNTELNGKVIKVISFDQEKEISQVFIRFN